MKPATQLFEYAIIRVVPCVEKEEFINAGVILYCAGYRFLNVLHQLNENKLLTLYANADVHAIQQRLSAFEKIAKADTTAGTIAALPIASRFRWLTAAKSTVIQTSPVHPGLCIDPQSTLLKLFQQLVL